MEFVDVGKLIKNLNPVNGCDIGCTYCYARRINQRFKITPDFEIPTYVPERIKRIYTKKANTYLMTSMSDFSSWNDNWKTEVFKAIEKNPQHEYLFLTKRPENIKFSTQLNNVWMGVTVTTNKEADRINQLINNVSAKNYFITFEPLFSNIENINLDKINWIVIGTETGNRKGKITAQKEWILNIVKQAKQF
ncbi:MAG: DUF5131 family protein, partial [Erysipelotrichaceae bacterium]